MYLSNLTTSPSLFSSSFGVSRFVLGWCCGLDVICDCGSFLS